MYLQTTYGNAPCVRLRSSLACLATLFGTAVGATSPVLTTFVIVASQNRGSSQRPPWSPANASNLALGVHRSVLEKRVSL